MARDGVMSAFAGDPQPVEVFHRGRWYAGELLGWRHDEDGRCWVRVRVVVDRLRHSAWMDLTDLRLPAPAPAPAPPRPRTAPPVPAEEDADTRPHLLLLGSDGRGDGRPPVPSRAAVPPAVAPAPAAVPPPAAPADGRGVVADEVATTRGFPLPVG